MVIERIDEPLESYPIVEVHPDNVSVASPVTYRLLEKADATGFVVTEDLAEKNEVQSYLRKVSGIYENLFNVHYKERLYYVGPGAIA